MAAVRNRRPAFFLAAGLFGISLYFIADRYHWPIIPANDFFKGLWFGVCLGAELLGGLLLLRSKRKPRC